MRIRNVLTIYLFVLLTFALIGCEEEIPDEQTYTIVFETNGGTPVESLDVLEGGKLPIPTTSREGYTLDGWYTSVNGGITLDEKWSFVSDIIGMEMTLYAKWIANVYQVSFDGQGANDEDEIIDVSVTYDGFYGDLPLPLRTGHSFTGWSFDSLGTDMLDEQTIVDTASDHTLYAIWQINQYTISFDSSGGSIVQSIIQDYTTAITDPEDPTREGYTFMGWDPAVPETMPARDFSLTAQWSINQYTISFDSNSGSIVESITQDYATTITAPEDPTREGYTFAGWHTDQTFNDIYVFDRMPAEDITVYALWHNTISFESNDGSYVPAITMLAGEEIEEPETPSRIEATFIGWFIDEEFTEEFVFSTMPEPNITLYAKWDLNQYTVTFETNGGVLLDSVTLDYGTSLADYQPSREGYVFSGWYLEDTFETQVTTVPAMDITLHAWWEITDMVQVGETDTVYIIPTGTDDSGSTTVEGGYLMATTETTYELWYEVRIWAEANGYYFQNQGREGNEGTIGAAPTANKLEPMTTASWRDVIVWLNAASEMVGFHPVYRTSDGAIIRDSRDANASVVDSAVQTENNGYRLPTSYEWEMAARWRNSDADGSILGGGRYWTPGDYASGASADYNNSSATGLVSWYDFNSGSRTHPVGEKTPNHLGLYDMSGNIWEWIYDWHPSYEGSSRIHRGGSYGTSADHPQVGYFSGIGPHVGSSSLGFRMVRTP